MGLVDSNRLEVYTDGNCNLCRWIRTRVEPLDRNARIRWLDYNDPEVLMHAAPHTRDEMAKEMHARASDGRAGSRFVLPTPLVRAPGASPALIEQAWRFLLFRFRFNFAW